MVHIEQKRFKIIWQQKHENGNGFLTLKNNLSDFIILKVPKVVFI